MTHYVLTPPPDAFYSLLLLLRSAFLITTNARQQEKQDRIVSADAHNKKIFLSRCRPTMTESFFFFTVLLTVVSLAMVVHAGENGVACVEPKGQQQQKGCISSDDMAADESGLESVVSEKEIES